MGMVKINKDALQKELKKRDLYGTDVSLEMGFEKNYISSCCNRGLMQKPAINLLEKMFSIKPETYTFDENRGGDAGQQVFSCDDIVEELKAIRGLNQEMAEMVANLRYVVNIMAKELKLVRGELVEIEGEEIVGETTEG